MKSKSEEEVLYPESNYQSDNQEYNEDSIEGENEEEESDDEDYEEIKAY